MAISRARLEPLLLGRDTGRSLREAAVAVGLFVVVFSVTGRWLDQSISVIGSLFPGLVLLLALLAGAVTYDNEGLLVAALLTGLPTYAVAVHLAHVGNTGPNPYPTAAVVAVPLAAAFAVPLALLGGGLGLAARRYAD